MLYFITYDEQTIARCPSTIVPPLDEVIQLTDLVPSLPLEWKVVRHEYQYDFFECRVFVHVVPHVTG